MADKTRWDEYVSALRRPFVKVCRLSFMNPDGTVAFAVDNDANNAYGTAFIESGNLSVNLQNGQRRNVIVTLSNVTGKFSYDINHLWFGRYVRLEEGLILPDGTKYYIPQGVFVITEPEETLANDENSMQISLIDKWADIDGTLGGNLDGTYTVETGTNIFEPIISLLSEDKGNGEPIDPINPVFTTYYNGLTQKLTDGTTVSMLLAPYELEVDAGSTKADVILGLNDMINGLVGYDSYGELRIDASQDDVSDMTKPVAWRFSMDEATLIGLTYKYDNTSVYNDYVVVGESLSDYGQPAARAENHDYTSDTNIELIGRKTYYESKSGYGTDTQCADYAQWKLKRAAVMQKEVTITCSQIFHISENDLVEIIRTDKEGSPLERHVIQGFSRPLTSTDPMTINCVSVNDYPNITVTKYGEE